MGEPSVTITSEPPTPRSVRWRLGIYPVALAVGALSAAIRNNLPLKIATFVVFALLMLTPLALKLHAWGGVRRAWEWFFRKRLTLTRGGFLFLSMTVLFGVAAINTGTNLLYLILAMLLSLIVVSGILSEMVVKGLRISRRLPPYVFAGEEFRVQIAVVNPRRLFPSFALEVREEKWPAAAPASPGADAHSVFFLRLDRGERRALLYAAKIERRGVYPLTGLVLATSFPFGFFIKFARAALAGEIVVYPRPRELSPEAVRALGRVDESPRPRPFHHSPDEFRSTREYRAGDNPRWIHWRSSARQRRLVVKEFEPRATRVTAVVLDSDPGGAADPDEVLDRGTTLAASLLEYLLGRDERPELAMLSGGEVVRFGAQARGAGGALGSRAGLAACLEALARLVPGRDPDFDRLIEAARPALRRGARVIVLTARNPGLARRAIEGAEPGAADSLDVLSFATEEAVAPLYAPVPAARANGSLAGRGHGSNGARAEAPAAALAAANGNGARAPGGSR